MVMNLLKIGICLSAYFRFRYTSKIAKSTVLYNLFIRYIGIYLTIKVVPNGR